MTDFCREREISEGGRLGSVASRAKERYLRAPGAVQVNVSAAFTPTVAEISHRQLIVGLADFVASHQNESARFSWDDTALPEGYCLIIISSPRELTGHWDIGQPVIKTAVEQELIQDRILAKSAKLPFYRTKVPEVWLLMINDRYLGAGEVYARPDWIANWQFDFDFNKVVVFLREASGVGQLIELNKAPI